MMVLKVYMWPSGDQSCEYLMAQATFDLQGVAQRDEPGLGVRKGERAYRVRLLKDTAFGGPQDGVDVNPRLTPKSRVWREGRVRGHIVGRRGRAARGTWDLIGGALRVLLGSRLDRYVDGGAE